MKLLTAAAPGAAHIKAGLPWARQAMFAVVGAGAVALSGCVVPPVEDGYYAADPYYSSSTTIIYDRYGYPPPLRVETRPVMPGAGYIWQSGAWEWGGQRYNWRPGRWQAPHRPGVHGSMPPPPPPPQVRPPQPPRPQVQPPRPSQSPGWQPGRAPDRAPQGGARPPQGQRPSAPAMPPQMQPGPRPGGERPAAGRAPAPVQSAPQAQPPRPAAPVQRGDAPRRERSDRPAPFDHQRERDGGRP